MRLAILTGGGDCPGLNAVIRGAVRKASGLGWTTLGVADGWAGLAEGRWRALGMPDVRGILPRGGTILGTSGIPGFSVEKDLLAVRATLADMQADALMVIGGEGTLAGAAVLADDGFHVVGVPKTIDNDLSGTDVTFGFDTAVGVAMEAIDRLHTTADSHHRMFVVEVMGRNAGWIALHAGIAGGANAILIPEIPFSFDELEGWVQSRFASGFAPIIVTSERAMPDEPALVARYGTTDPFGATYIDGVGPWLGTMLQERTGHEARTTTLGHVQRGGTPSAFDRVLATRLALAAVDTIDQGRSGRMVAVRGNDIVEAPLTEAIGTLNTVPLSRYREVSLLFG